MCVGAISVPTAADLPSLLANAFQVGSPYFVMSTHMFAELDVMICKSTSLAGSIPRWASSELVPGHMRSQATTRLFDPLPSPSSLSKLGPTRSFWPLLVYLRPLPSISCPLSHFLPAPLALSLTAPQTQFQIPSFHIVPSRKNHFVLVIHVPYHPVHRREILLG